MGFSEKNWYLLTLNCQFFIFKKFEWFFIVNWLKLSTLLLCWVVRFNFNYTIMLLGIVKYILRSIRMFLLVSGMETLRLIWLILCIFQNTKVSKTIYYLCSKFFGLKWTLWWSITDLQWSSASDNLLSLQKKACISSVAASWVCVSI